MGAVVLLPLAAAALLVLLPRRTPPWLRGFLGLAAAMLTAAGTMPMVVSVSSGHVVELAMGGFAAPLGIHLRADGLSAVFLALTALVGLVLSVAAAGSERTHRWFFPLWLGCWSGLNAVFISGDLFNTYVGLELVGLSAVALVALGGKDSYRPALRYLLIAVLGSLMLLVGIALLVSVTGTLDIAQAAEALGPEQAPATLTALALITVGLALKLALLPMHSWLIGAHSAAPTVVSPLLSGLVIKAALFVLLRCWLWLGAATGAVPLAWVLGALGAAAVILGSILALRQDRLKPLIAYSTVAQVGYWFLAFPLLINGSTEIAQATLIGVVALAVGHGVAKAGMFLGAGYLKDTYGTDEIAALRGAGRAHRLVIMGMGLAGVGLIGLPVSLGFTGKWQLATAAVGASQWWILAVLALATLLSAAYVLRALGSLLMQEDKTLQQKTDTETADDDHHDVALLTWDLTSVQSICVLGLGVLTLVTGFSGVWLGRLVEVGGPW